MRLIRSCSNCSGPVTIKMARCPHCQARNPAGVVARALSAAAMLVGGFSVSSTLAACYGAPCADDNDPACRSYTPRCGDVSSQPTVDDKDGDGYCKAQDCNEMDAKINVTAIDVPNDGIDQNCDGQDTKR